MRRRCPEPAPTSWPPLIATPLERQFGAHRRGHRDDLVERPRLDQRSPSSSTSLATSTAQPATSRPPSAPRAPTCPPTCPAIPTYRKVNPADSPIMVLALTSDKSTSPDKVYDEASTVIVQKLSQIQGVGQVSAGGGTLAVRSRRGQSRPSLRAMAWPSSNHPVSPQPAERRPRQGSDLRRPDIPMDIVANDQISHAAEYQAHLIIGYSNGAAVRLEDVADVIDSDLRTLRTAGYFDGKRAVRADHLAPARREHHRNRRPYLRRAAVDQGLDSQRHRDGRHDRPHDHHPRLGLRCRADAR